MITAELKHGDSFLLLKEMETGSASALITDPPYNISEDNNFTTMGRAGTDFGEWDKDFDLTGWIADACRIVKPGGNIVIFNSWTNFTPICEELERCGCDIKDMIRWVKTNPMPRNTDRRFVVDSEYAVWATKPGKPWVFNTFTDGYERPEVRCSRAPESEKKDGEHPTQKPVAVMEWIIARLTNEGDTILDPFMGSGTTGVASQNLRRSFKGIEKELEHYTTATKRIVTDIVSAEDW